MNDNSKKTIKILTEKTLDQSQEHETENSDHAIKIFCSKQTEKKDTNVKYNPVGPEFEMPLIQKKIRCDLTDSENVLEILM